MKKGESLFFIRGVNNGDPFPYYIKCINRTGGLKGEPIRAVVEAHGRESFDDALRGLEPGLREQARKELEL